MALEQLRTFPRANDLVRVEDAYRAVLRLLDYYAGMPAASIDQMQIELGDPLNQGKPCDPAAWPLWLDCMDGRDPKLTGNTE